MILFTKGTPTSEFCSYHYVKCNSILFIILSHNKKFVSIYINCYQQWVTSAARKHEQRRKQIIIYT
jgi:hypothetical protein